MPVCLSVWMPLIRAQQHIASNLFSFWGTGEFRLTAVMTLSEKIAVMVVTSSADRPQIYLERIRNLSGEVIREQLVAVTCVDSS